MEIQRSAEELFYLLFKRVMKSEMIHIELRLHRLMIVGDRKDRPKSWKRPTAENSSSFIEM